MMGTSRRVPPVSLRMFCICGLLVAICSPTVRAAEPTGLIDVSDHGMDGDRILPLSGTWEIYWQQLLTPGDFDGAEEGGAEAPEPDGVFEMPGTWNDWPQPDEGVGGTGFATFRVDVLLPAGMRRGALRVPAASTAYRLWANGIEVAASGTPGANRTRSRPAYRMSTGRFNAPDGRLELVLQVSNFHHRRGGMWRPIELGTVERIESKDALETAYDLLLIGSFVALALYNVMLYRAGGRRARAPLFLSLLFCVLAFRIAMMGQMMATRLFPGFPWGVQLRIEYLTAHFALLALTLTLNAIYPRIIGRGVTGGAGVLTAVNTISVLAMPILVYSQLVRTYVYAMLCVLAVEVVLLAVAFARGRRETWPGLGAAGITFLITLGETIHYQELILSRDFAPFGFLITLVAGDSVNQTVSYLVSAGINLALVFLVANVIAVRGSRSLIRLERRTSGGDGNGDGTARALAHPPAPDFDAAALPAYGITRREAEIIALAARGLSNKEIGAALYVSEATVKTHMYRILRKTGAGNRTELSRWYYAMAAEPGDVSADAEAE